MRHSFFLLLALFAFCFSASAAESKLKRYLYLSTPDGAQEGGSGKGILVFDGVQADKLTRHVEKGGQNLLTVKEYGDVDLYVDWCIEAGADSGVWAVPNQTGLSQQGPWTFQVLPFLEQQPLFTLDPQTGSGGSGTGPVKKLGAAAQEVNRGPGDLCASLRKLNAK